jgi:hypothetical protein
VLLGLLASMPAARAETGKLLLTGGVTSVDGAAGGGISPWATIGTYAAEGEIGGSANMSHLQVQDYSLGTYGVAAALDNRWEASLSQQDFDASVATGLNALGFNVSPGQHIRVNALGLKARLAGEAILDSDTWMPQLSAGVLFKQTEAGSIKPVLDFLGAKTEGTAYYLSAAKLLLKNSVLLNATLRYTNANQGGLLGFGSKAPGTDGLTLQPEFSVGYLLSKHLVVGAEYRSNPNNLEALGRAAGLGSGLASDGWQDVFVAWAPTKHFSLTFAYADLGRVLPAITNGRNQNGFYIAAQIAQ